MFSNRNNDKCALALVDSTYWIGTGSIWVSIFPERSQGPLSLSSAFLPQNFNRVNTALSDWNLLTLAICITKPSAKLPITVTEAARALATLCDRAQKYLILFVSHHPWYVCLSRDTVTVARNFELYLTNINAVSYYDTVWGNFTGEDASDSSLSYTWPIGCLDNYRIDKSWVTAPKASTVWAPNVGIIANYQTVILKGNKMEWNLT
jgi:hypothetical protein